MREEVDALTDLLDEQVQIIGDLAVRVDDLEANDEEKTQQLDELRRQYGELLQTLQDHGQLISSLERREKEQDELLAKYERFFQIVAKQLNITSMLQ